MIYLTLENKLWIKVETTDRKCFDLIKEHFSFYVDGFMFMPAYKAGAWDGRVYIFDYKHRRLPYGLLFDLIKLLKKHKYEIKASDELKELFGNNDNLNISYNLKFSPRYYQEDIVETFLNYKKGLFVSATASGKSLIISYIINNLFKNNLINKSIIIVPTTNLILQFYNDLIDYGIDENIIGKYYAEEKDENKPILISTWQSLCYDNEKIRKSELNTLRKEVKKKTLKKDEKDKKQKRLKLIQSKQYIDNINYIMENRQSLLESIDCFIIDEVQTAKSTEVNELTKKIINAEYRCGCTGTLPDSKLDLMNIKSFIGPVIKEYSTKELTDAGFLNPCEVHIDYIQYRDKIIGKYNEVKDEVFSNTHRLNYISNKINNIDNNILILVGKVEKEGKVLEQYLKEQFPDKQVKFLYGNIKTEEREKWRQKCIEEDNVIIIAIYQIFQAGINIPNLKYVMLGSSFKSKIRILQSLGRLLRMSQGKGKSVVIDIVDDVPALRKHIKERKTFYEKEEHDIIENVYKEGH